MIFSKKDNHATIEKHIETLLIENQWMILENFTDIPIEGKQEIYDISGINLIFPVLGTLFSGSLSGLFVLLFFIFKKLTLGGAMTLGLPTLVATITFSMMTRQRGQNSFRIRVYNFLLL